MPLSYESIADRFHLDPDAEAGLHRVKLAEGFFLDIPVDHVGYRRPGRDQLIVALSAFAGQEVAVIVLYDTELVWPPKPEDVVVRDGVHWVVRSVESRAFKTTHHCLCTKSVGGAP